MAAPASSKPDKCHYCGKLPGKDYFITMTERIPGFIVYRWACGECWRKAKL